ncbi:MAG: ABC transporter ATP-binding protein [Phycisphaerales bacterium]|nr:MAG: ABC transporter ATP-binding protein [Phycisphaerales bacterium]
MPDIKNNQIRLARYIARHKVEIELTLVCAVVTVGINLYLPFIVRGAIDGLTDGTITSTGLTKELALYAGLSAITLYFSRNLRKIPLKLSHKVEYALRKDVFDHLTRMDQDYFRKERTGDLITRMSSDMLLVRDSIGQGLLQGIRTTGVLLFASIIMLVTDTTLALLVLSLYLPMTLVFFLVLMSLRRRQKPLQEKVSDVSSFCQESFSGVRCIKGFAIEQRRIGTFESINRDLVRLHLRMQRARQALWPFMAFWFCLSVVMILNIGGREVINGRRSLGTLVQFVQYLLYMQWPLLALSWVASLLQRGKVSWNRIKEILEQEPAIKDSDQTDYSIKSLHGDIVLEDLSLDIGERRFLHDINLSIDSGKTLGITGPTGSGKTLLVSLVARLTDPTHGRICIDGHDVRIIPLELLRNHIGFAAQEPVLFSQTLEHNIGFGVDEPDQGLIHWAADIAHLRKDVETFPEKYETVIGERGVTLSGGQRQRTSISRAVARHPEILILDDVLSAVDTQTEAAIMDKLRPVMKERTTLFVSHRISTLRYADEIIVIEDGRITQRGSHDELAARPGYYCELNTMQQIEKEMEPDS